MGLTIFTGHDQVTDSSLRRDLLGQGGHGLRGTMTSWRYRREGVRGPLKADQSHARDFRISP